MTRPPKTLRPFLALALAVAGATPLAAHASPQDAVAAPGITVLSSRPDLVSGGDALVEINLPRGAHGLRVHAGRRDITSAFAKRADGRTMGLVTELPLGRTTLRATATDLATTSLTVVNHPNGGPIFAGEQIKPWPCLTGAIDKHCDEKVHYQYWYRPANTIAVHTATGSEGTSEFSAYDPNNPPPAGNIATTTTDNGNTVPYIVREEIGAQDRGEYRIAVLFDPKRGWQPWAPQRAWNGKAFVTGGAGCGTNHGEGTSPSVLSDIPLSRGYAVISTSLDHNTNNCNLVVQAEALTMLKERFVEAYGPIRYTIGYGSSGGAIMLQQVTNAYPGIFDGIIPAASFPDSWSSVGEVEDCALLEDYWSDPSKWGTGVVWTEQQLADVVGQESLAVCLTWRDVFGFTYINQPRRSTHPLDEQSCNVTVAQAWDPVTNPHGIRCDLADYMVSVFGRRADGKANRPLDNVGVQYGLNALKAGKITPAQFVDVNTKIGSHDIDYDAQPRRVSADPPALTTAYRGGLANEANNMARTPIIDLRGHETYELHQDYRSYLMRARLDRANGNHDNQVIWLGALSPYTFTGGDQTFEADALTVMDEWLARVTSDKRALPLSRKVALDKPAAAHDRCTDGHGNDIQSSGLCPTLFPYYGSPRIAAGGPFADDILKCQLKPLRASDYSPVQFTDAQLAQLKRVFPTGVCDWSKPGVAQQPSIPWQNYSAGPGGQPMPAAPLPTTD